MDPLSLLIYALVGVIILAALFFLTRSFIPAYRRVPPNRVMVLYGRGRSVFAADGSIQQTGVRMVVGGGTFVWPILEEFQFLDLNVMTIVKTGDEVYTVDGVPIKLDWVAQVQIESTEKALMTAARAFLGMSRENVVNVIAQTLSANFRAIVGQLTVEAVHRDRDTFVQNVQGLASDDMAAMGVQVISMGIEEITDDQGYFEAMAKPKIAAIKRDATIAEAEAEREARMKAAQARQQAEQTELEASRSILEQRQALELREVEKSKTVSLAQAKAEEEVLRQRAAQIQQQQEVDVLTPARAKREATQIEAEAESRKLTVIAEAKAKALRQESSSEAEALEITGRAEAEKQRALAQAQADGARAQQLAQAEGTRAILLAEAEGKERLAQASAAQGEINLRQTIAQLLIQAEVDKAQAIAEALAGIDNNVRIVQFGNGEQPGGQSNALINLLRDVPELATVINAKTEALSGQSIEQVLARVAGLFKDNGGEKPKEE